MFIAHTRTLDSVTQPLDAHLMNVGSLSEKFAQKLNLGEIGALLGLLHDLGKFSDNFQNYIKYNSFNSDKDDAEINNNIHISRVDHSTCGAQWIKDHFLNSKNNVLLGQILSICIASHHGKGLIDVINNNEKTWFNRLKKSRLETNFQSALSNALNSNSIALKKAVELNESSFDTFNKHISSLYNSNNLSYIEKKFYLGCLTKFLFSCLIDADRIDSADFESNTSTSDRNIFRNYEWDIALKTLENHLKNFSSESDIQKIRESISNKAFECGSKPKNIFKFTVPTGGGKTLSSLRFALKHCLEHKLDRIIYVIPFTSIIDQNAQVVRKVLGDEWVHEHHSNIEPEEVTWKNKLISSNWDKPIIFTTMVQFLDSWFSIGTRGVRHIHPMTNSVIIFDEIQSLPLKCTYLFCNVINWLNLYGNSSIVLSTATQPPLELLEPKENGALKFDNDSEIIGNLNEVDELYDNLSRVNIHFDSVKKDIDKTFSFVKEIYNSENKILFIANTKKTVLDLFNKFKENNYSLENIYALTTYQCPSHRKAIINELKEKLRNNEKTVCISTQLIEAGVDISFQTVIRVLAGLDSIAQAAGRCNRNKEQDKGNLYIIDVLENLDKLPEISNAKVSVQAVLHEFNNDLHKILKPDAINKYFKQYYELQRNELIYPIESEQTSMLDLLSANSDCIYRKDLDDRLLKQSFRIAAENFKSIDAPTKSVICPYEKGLNLIAILCGEWDPKKFRETLIEAQQFSVALYPSTWKMLLDEGAIHPINDTGIYYLDEKYYDSKLGLNFEGNAQMGEFYI